MTRVRRLPVVCVAALAVVVAALAAPALRAQEGATGAEIERRVQWLRALPPEERARLRSALRAFRDLPQSERDALRRRAASLGPERLEGLAGRDLRKLGRLRGTVEGETDAIVAQLGPETLAALNADEREYVRAEVKRGFQRHLRRKLLGAGSYEEFESLPADERIRRERDALRRVVEDRMARMPDEERRRILALPPAARAAERARLLAEHRSDEAVEFARIFSRWRLEKFLQMPADKRAEVVRRWRERARWTEVVRVLRTEIGIADATARDLAALGPREWAQVAAEVQATEAQPADDRRTRIETLVHRLAGERALAPDRGRPPLPPLLQRLRERRLASPPPPR